MAALFDTIHDDALGKRAEPATLAEFGVCPKFCVNTEMRCK